MGLSFIEGAVVMSTRMVSGEAGYDSGEGGG